MEKPVRKLTILHVVPNRTIGVRVIEDYLSRGFFINLRNGTAEDNDYKYWIITLSCIEECFEAICGHQFISIKFHEDCLLDGRTLNYIMSRMRLPVDYLK